jgi:hypothetical protein
LRDRAGQARDGPDAESVCGVPGRRFTSIAGPRDGDSIDESLTLAERWNGSTWSIQSTPSPIGATASSLDGVSCTSAIACTAVGSFGNGSFETAFAEQWNGNGWSIQNTPIPSGAVGSNLNDVSCSSATACSAVGSYNASSTGPELTLVERWNGNTWSIQNTPIPTNPNAELWGVSCTSATTCTAVGLVNSGTATLAEAWSGTSWSIESAQNPGPDSYFLGVSCTSAIGCTAVGSFSPNPNAQVVVPLVERQAH